MLSQSKFPLLIEIEKNALKFIWSHKKTQYSQKWARAKREMLLNYHFRPQYIPESQSNKNNMVWAQWGHVCQRNKLKDPNMRIGNCSHLIFDKCIENIHWRKDGVFKIWCWKNWMPTCRRLKLDLYPFLLTKTNSKWTMTLEKLNAQL